MENDLEKYPPMLKYDREGDAYYLVDPESDGLVDPIEFELSGITASIHIVTGEELLDDERSFVYSRKESGMESLYDLEFTKWLYTNSHVTPDSEIDINILSSCAKDFFIDFIMSEMHIIIETEILESFDINVFKSFISELVYLVLADNIGMHDIFQEDKSIANDAHLFMQCSFFLEDVESARKYVEKYLGSSSEMLKYLNDYLGELLEIFYHDDSDGEDGDFLEA